MEKSYRFTYPTVAGKNDQTSSWAIVGPGTRRLKKKKQKTRINQSVFQGTGLPGGSDSKESACNAEVLGWIPGLGRFPGERNSYPFWYSWLENPLGQRSLVDSSPWGCKELDTAERLSHSHSKEHLFNRKLIGVWWNNMSKFPENGVETIQTRFVFL